ncbi:SMI1/KNR4 family protein [Streptomyces sp. NPDC020412]|uniref:SMI1/KNR4 family protein n=1 Tax=Streptomyces sp. NPDC020412 TaxID=3365073 RepID=UPI00379B4BD9
MTNTKEQADTTDATGATDGTPFDWRPFLRRWSGEWADSVLAQETVHEDDEAVGRARWLGFPPASEEGIVAMEQRLGVRMPPSYREFLQVCDGWRHAGGSVYWLAGTAEARWHDNESGLADIFEECLDEDSEPEERQEADLWRRGLQLDVESDGAYVLMDPEDVDEDGEWAVYTWAGWRAAPPERYANFAEFMRDMHKEFHRLRSRPGDGEPEFVNDTTRELDARMAQARLDALRGDWGGALAAFDEAFEYGRPGAAELGDQIRRLLREPCRGYVDESATVRRHGLEMMTGPAARMRVSADTYRYAPAGPFGEAVSRARESARWGDTDGAWRTFMAALPAWTPLGPDDLAPLGWLADPLLGPLITSERGRELLATPKGGQPGEAPEPTAGLDPSGLAWLADPDPYGNRRPFRFVLVEGVQPQDLPGRLADGDATALDDPMTSDEARHRLIRGAREFSSFDDKALAAVGRAGPRWSFAYDGGPASFDAQRFVSPAAEASAGTRAVVVWSDLRSDSEPFFHLSVAQNGIEQYAFTYEDGRVRRTGAIPAALDPDRFFGSGEDVVQAERSLLEAVTGEYDAHLPRHAIRQGRLHWLTTRSWTRPPADGESYVVVSVWRGGVG